MKRRQRKWILSIRLTFVVALVAAPCHGELPFGGAPIGVGLIGAGLTAHDLEVAAAKQKNQNAQEKLDSAKQSGDPGAIEQAQKEKDDAQTELDNKMANNQM